MFPAEIDFPDTDTVLHSSDNICLVYSPAGDNKSTTLVVTFSAIIFDHMKHAPRKGQSRETIRNLGFDAIHVLPSGNDWYQYEDIYEIYSKISDFAKNYNKFVTYGQSMGGYAVVSSTKLLKPYRAIAVCPQATIDSSKINYKTGFEKISEKTKFIRDDFEVNVDKNANLVVFYDPLYSVDKNHYYYIRNYVDTVHGVAMPFSGHDVGASLRDAGILLYSFETMFGDSNEDISNIRKKYRSLRGESILYNRSKTKHQVLRLCDRGRVQEADKLAFDCKEKDPSVDSYRSWAEIAERHLSSHEASVRWLEAIKAVGPRVGSYAYVRGIINLRKDNQKEQADILSSEGINKYPKDFGILRERADVLIQKKCFFEARHCLNVLAEVYGERGDLLRQARISKYPRLA